ncbi:hypothetical protein E2C01_001728 [Portunus trituberculatus]|uniref:Uncharacterized protein n=1 Tax=Portunus trituberculatus TaxID=210409 RepID=A0A5B7CIN8_PORTR|nr:hypothetical protein [Portunus trituberculatus]
MWWCGGEVEHVAVVTVTVVVVMVGGWWWWWWCPFQEPPADLFETGAGIFGMPSFPAWCWTEEEEEEAEEEEEVEDYKG